MAELGVDFDVDTSPTKEAVVNSLTRDVSERACIFDLIDNAVDAARDNIFEKIPREEWNTLPNSYAGYGIEIKLSGSGYSIQDTCGGISVEKLQSMVLKFGLRSSHNMGIGIFGVGLNRALFKLSRVTHLKTDNGKERAELVLDLDEYLTTEGWQLPAKRFPTYGELGTLIEGSELPAEISSHFGEKKYVDGLRKEIGQRYGRFIQKGFKIKLNGVLAKNNEVPMRRNSPYEGEEKFFKSADGVRILLKIGQHMEHRFSSEKDYDKARNDGLTDQYGWNVLCNDRTIVIRNTGWETGWETDFHSEFYGFVGYAEFIDSDPSKLPWNTAKTDIDLNNKAYRAALDEMRKFTKSWRSYCNWVKRRKNLGEELSPSPGPGPVSPDDSGEGKQPEKEKPKKPAQPAIVIKPTKKDDHNQYRTVLPQDVDELHCYDKHLALVHEGKRLDMHLLSYSGLALIRNLFEASATVYLRRHNHYPAAKDAAIARRKSKGMKMTAAEEKKAKPAFDELLEYLTNNPDVLNIEKQNKLKYSLSRVGARQKLLNAAVHDVDQQIHRSEAFQIRDEIVPILRHLIET